MTLILTLTLTLTPTLTVTLTSDEPRDRGVAEGDMGETWGDMGRYRHRGVAEGERAQYEHEEGIGQHLDSGQH